MRAVIYFTDWTFCIRTERHLRCSFNRTNSIIGRNGKSTLQPIFKSDANRHKQIKMCNSNEVSLLAQNPTWSHCYNGRGNRKSCFVPLFGWCAQFQRQLDFRTTLMMMTMRMKTTVHLLMPGKWNGIFEHWLHIFDYWFAYFSGILAIPISQHSSVKWFKTQFTYK